MNQVKENILAELEHLIAESCRNYETLIEFNQLHIDIVKKYYNATTVEIDHQRNRIEMDIIIDEAIYNPKKMNTYLPTIPTNLIFNNLRYFLKNCLESDRTSIAFYAQLIQTFSTAKILQVA